MAAKTQLEKCFECIIDVFHKYSIKYAHHDKLSKSELSNLIKEQLANFLHCTKNPHAIDILFKELDQNKDQELSFDETMVFMCKMIMETHDKFHEKHGH